MTTAREPGWGVLPVVDVVVAAADEAVTGSRG